MNRPVGAAASSGALVLIMVILGVVNDGFGPPLLVSAVGLIVFGIGIVGGIGTMITVGLGTAVIGASVSTDASTLGLMSLVTIGVMAVAALQLADASGWLRRDPRVDAAVVRGVVLLAALCSATGVLAAMALLALAGSTTWTNWLIPAAIAGAAVVVGAGGELTRRRHLTRLPGADDGRFRQASS